MASEFSDLKKVITNQRKRLIDYSYYKFLINEMDNHILFQKSVVDPLINNLEKNEYKIWSVESSDIFVIYQYLDWESNFFNTTTYKIVYILYAPDDIDKVSKEINNFISSLGSNIHIYTDIPSQDLNTIRVLENAGFCLVETRLHFTKNIHDFNTPLQRYNVRFVNENDKENLMEVASNMRNPFDRVHADPFINDNFADKYLATFAGNCVEGFADITIVPDDSLPADCFLAANKPHSFLEKKISKLVLASVSSQNRKGWLKKLSSEMLLIQKTFQTDYLTTITQPANIGSIRAWEHLQFKLYNCSNIFSKFNS